MPHDRRICAEACEGNSVCAGRELASQIKHSHARSDFVGFKKEEEDGVSYGDNLQACGHCWQSCKEGLSWQGKPGNEMETLQKLRFFQNNFPKANSQKGYIEKYFKIFYPLNRALTGAIVCVCCPEPSTETLKIKSTLSRTLTNRLSLEKFASGKQTVLKKPSYLMQV